MFNYRYFSLSAVLLVSAGVHGQMTEECKTLLKQYIDILDSTACEVALATEPDVLPPANYTASCDAEPSCTATLILILEKAEKESCNLQRYEPYGSYLEEFSLLETFQCSNYKCYTEILPATFARDYTPLSCNCLLRFKKFLGDSDYSAFTNETKVVDDTTKERECADGQAELVVEIPMSLDLDGIDSVDIPEDGKALEEFADVIEPALKEVSGADYVDIKAINGKELDTLARSSKDGVKVDFAISLFVNCDGSDCTSALDDVSAEAKAVADNILNSMSNGSFVNALVESAESANEDALKGVTVNATSFSSGEPIVNVTESDTDDEESIPTDILNRFLDFIKSILDIFIGFMY